MAASVAAAAGIGLGSAALIGGINVSRRIGVVASSCSGGVGVGASWLASRENGGGLIGAYRGGK